MLRSAIALNQVMRDLKVPVSGLTPLVHERLRRILVSAYRHVPYYRETMKSLSYDPEKDFTGPDDLRKLPILTKQTIQDLGGKAFLNERMNLSRCTLDRTSGSTGQPMEIWRDSPSQALVLAKYYRALLVNGYGFTDKVLGFRSQKIRVIEMGGWLRYLGLLRWQKVDLLISTREMVDHLLAYDPDVLYGNLVHIELIAQELDRRNLRTGRLKLLLPGGEVVTDGHRRRLEEAFGARVAVTYGSVELGLMAFDTPEKPGLRLCEDLVHYEFLDADGKPAVTGQRSRPIVTDLTNYVMPFIRFDHEDWVSVASDSTEESDDWRRLVSIEGRENEFFRLSDGSVITFLVPYETMKNYSKVRQFRLVQKERDLIQIQISGDREYLDSIARNLVEDFKKASPAIAEYVCVPMDRISPDKNGKLRTLVSELES